MLGLVIGLLQLALLPSVAWSRSHHHKHEREQPVASPSAARGSASPPVAASELEPPPAGEAGAPDYAAILRELEAGYRQSPSPEELYRMGQLQYILGHVVESQDLMRRYLADPLADPLNSATASHRADAERVAELSRVPSGEVQVAAEQEGLILVDGRLVGAMPLAMPLLVPVGPHVVSLEMRDKTMKGKLKVLDGRGAVMRFSLESGAVLITLPPAVIVLPRYKGSLPGDAQRRLQQTAEQMIQKARLAVYSREAALSRAPELAKCLAEASCQGQLARKSEVEYALALSIERRAPAASSLRVSLVDGETEDVAASAERSCADCTIEATSVALGELVARVLKEGPGRPRGTLSVTSQPPGAEVRAGTHVFGKTPYDHVVFAGSYDLTVEQPGFTPEHTQVTVIDGKKATAEVTLAEVVKPAPVPKPMVTKPRFYRPRWRLITGGVLLGAGLILGGIGISGIGINDQCLSPVEPPATRCRERFDTYTTGASLLGVGVGLSAAGAILIAVPHFPGERRPAP